MSRRLKLKAADRTGDRVKLHFSAIYLQSTFSSPPQTAGCSKLAQPRVYTTAKVMSAESNGNDNQRAVVLLCVRNRRFTGKLAGVPRPCASAVCLAAAYFHSPFHKTYILFNSGKRYWGSLQVLERFDAFPFYSCLFGTRDERTCIRSILFSASLTGFDKLIK